ncbi:MAG: D-tagatose-bisphosphate aldolase, class II, non-catalytic subunit, partial [Gammaproteobacteria bacterium]|nr:D-tagatose-bisphosphate aldolase, class II, non-catalytic subunit [Gammaproteobacteria bacterium]
MNKILDIIERHKSGQSVGVYSVCSAHPLVIEAALRRARVSGTLAVIESTSNQVNQDGGYTGMLPADFRDRVYLLADKVGLARSQVVLGGDHLGPNCWQELDAEEAMRKSEVLVSQYVAAGFRKIHLDCSMSCKNDPVPLEDAAVAARAARLCRVAEKSWQESGGEAPLYVVGTEVPVPGGATEDLDQLLVTDPDAAAQTILVHQRAFDELGLQSAWQRVIGLVVQPGVEFDHEKVVDFDMDKAAGLSKMIESYPGILFEAHSTDYQTTQDLGALVQGHFGILKVGPALTYALREAFWALDQVEKEWIPENQAAHLRHTLMDAMERDPTYWKKYYLSGGSQLKLDLQYSLSDRVRYYWPRSEVENAAARLIQ